MAKRIKVRPGVRYRPHAKRKHGVDYDKYWSIFYKLDGKMIEEGVGWSSKGWTEKKAAGLLAELQENQRRGERPFTLREKREMEEAAKRAEEQEAAEAEREALTFKEVFEKHFLPYSKEQKRNQKSWEREEALFRLWIVPVIGKKAMADVAPLHLEKIKSNMLKAGRSARSIAYALQVVRQVFNTAKRHRLYYGENPVKGVKFPKADNRRTRFLSHEEAAELLAALRKKSTDLHDQALFSLGSGARFSEVANLTWKDVNIERDEALLTGIDRTGKSGKSRTVPLTAEVVEMLKRRQAYAPEEQPLVFPSRTGEPMGQVSAVFIRTVNELGMNDGITDSRQRVVFHTLRHSYCSWLAMEGVPMYTLAQLSGHETLAMVQRYSHLSPGTLREAVSKLNGALTPKEKETETTEETPEAAEVKS